MRLSRICAFKGNISIAKRRCTTTTSDIMTAVARHFNTQDPIGLIGRLNLYLYAPNPIKWIDPLGWYNGEGVRQLGVYDVFHEKILAPPELKLNDAAHFSLANQSVHERMNA